MARLTHCILENLYSHWFWFSDRHFCQEGVTVRSYFQTSKSHIWLADKSGSEELKAGRCGYLLSLQGCPQCLHPRASLLRLQHQGLADWAAAFHQCWVCSRLHAEMSCAQSRISVSPRDVTLLLEKSPSNGMNIWKINYIALKVKMQEFKEEYSLMSSVVLFSV